MVALVAHGIKFTYKKISTEPIPSQLNFVKARHLNDETMLKNDFFRVQSGTAVRFQLHFSTAYALSAGISWGKWATLKKVGIPSQYLDCVLLDYCVFAWHQMDNNPLHQRGSTVPHTNQPRSDYGQWQLAKKIWRTQLWMILTYNDRSPLSIHLYLAWAGLELPANLRDKDVLLVSDREKFSQLPAMSSPHFFTCENCCLPNNTSSCFGRKSPQFVLRGTCSAANPLHYRGPTDATLLAAVFKFGAQKLRPRKQYIAPTSLWKLQGSRGCKDIGLKLNKPQVQWKYLTAPFSCRPHFFSSRSSPTLAVFIASDLGLKQLRSRKQIADIEMLNQGISLEYEKKTVVESSNLSCLVLTESNIRRSSWHLTTNFHAIPLVRKTMSMSSEVILAIFSRRSNLHFSTPSQVDWPHESYWLIHDGISLFDGQTIVPTKPSRIHPGYTAQSTSYFFSWLW